ncbi:class I SAM-dependent methyltransferase [Aquibaculum arenosum]|uniref:Class I SAM-dependent methyltransferase n=1 Tax=Aquibaculum arenosum TaxID=3032591 RepID=A0ABT5YJM4_9PROT|nr:class I SAM-dependent methyltransferase [Fodinicurvata sp. CAU 1616]MDF2095146.1 class I SAM-dependent methyltransferase [Fodinicurvata sp. CAU 1616]
MSEEQKRWQGYYRAVEGRPPRPTLLRALETFARESVAPGQAIDLGAGTGRDSLELLRRGWQVLAIDGQADALATLESKAPAGSRLETRACRFQDLDALPPCRLINASFSLPFCPPAAFPQLWRLIGDSLSPGGRFAGQLLGPGDDWAASGGVTSLDRQALDRLLSGWSVELCEEEESDSTTAKGVRKHWHLYHLVLRKP